MLKTFPSPRFCRPGFLAPDAALGLCVPGDRLSGEQDFIQGVLQLENCVPLAPSTRFPATEFRKCTSQGVSTLPHALFFFQLKNQPQQIPEPTLRLMCPQPVALGSLMKNDPSAGFPWRLSISKFQDLISISVSDILFCRVSFLSSVALLNLGHLFY